MADFHKALDVVLKNEGGYVNDPQDPGGETYKGVARNRNPSWPGWVQVDILKNARGFPENLAGDHELQRAVKRIYEINYWHKVRGDEIEVQETALSIFDFGVNCGPVASSKLAQMSAGAKVDGVIGKKTIAKINGMDTELFLSRFALFKLARYVNICEKRPASRKFFYGWCRRTLEGI